MIQGTPKFNGLAVAKIEIDFMKNPIYVDVQAAFINLGTGDTHGWTRGSPGWSDTTKQLAAQLRASMEQDLAAFHFSSGSSSQVDSTQKMSQSFSGLGEHLGGDGTEGAPSV